MKYLTDKKASAVKRATSLAFTWSYLVSLLASAVAIFYYAHLHLQQVFLEAFRSKTELQ